MIQTQMFPLMSCVLYASYIGGNVTVSLESLADTYHIYTPKYDHPCTRVPHPEI